MHVGHSWATEAAASTSDDVCGGRGRCHFRGASPPPAASSPRSRGWDTAAGAELPAAPWPGTTPEVGADWQRKVREGKDIIGLIVIVVLLETKFKF